MMSNHFLTAAHQWNAIDKVEDEKLACFVIMEDGNTAKEHGFNSLRNFGLRYLNLKESEYYNFWRRVTRYIDKFELPVNVKDAEKWVNKMREKYPDIRVVLENLKVTEKLYADIFGVNYHTFRLHKSWNWSLRLLVGLGKRLDDGQAATDSQTKDLPPLKRKKKLHWCSESEDIVSLDEICDHLGMPLDVVEERLVRGNDLSQALEYKPWSGMTRDECLHRWDEDIWNKGETVLGRWFKDPIQCAQFYGLPRSRLLRLVKEKGLSLEEAFNHSDKKNRGLYSFFYFDENEDECDIPAFLYVIKFRMENKDFVKIGITSEKTIKKRVQGFVRDYTELAVYNGLLFDCFLAEHRILSALPHCPELKLRNSNLKFEGHTETFEVSDPSMLEELLVIVGEWAATADL